MRKRKKKKVDPITLLRACFPDIRHVAPIRGQLVYFVTDDGRVISIARGEPRVLAPKTKKDGHVAIRAGGRIASVARLVLETHGPGPRSRKFLAHHANGDVRDNRIENLSWISNSDWKRDVAHPKQRARVAKLDRRTAVVRIRSEYPDAGRLVAVDEYPNYFVDDAGRIYSLWGQKARRLVLRARATTGIALRRPDGRASQASWGGIVARAFLGPRPSTGHYVVHRDGDTSNVHSSNLAWEKRGAVPNAPSFTDDEVRAIRFLKAQGESSARIARAFDCGVSSADEIGWRVSYASVPDSSHDPIEALPARLRARVVEETRFGASLDPEAHRRAMVKAIRKAFPDVGPLRPLAEFADYFVTRGGEVYSTRREKVQRLTVTNDGVVSLSGPSGVVERSLDKLVRLAFGSSATGR